MKNIIITIVMFAIAAALIVGVVIPLATHGHEVGTGVETRIDTIDTSVGTLAGAVH